MSDQHMKCVSLTFGWKSLGNIERTEGPMRYTCFLIPAGYCGGSPDFKSKWTLFQPSPEGAESPRVLGPTLYQRVFSLGLATSSLSWYLSPLMAEECRQYNDPAVAKSIHQGEQVFALPVLKFLLSVIGKLAFSQMLKLWMSFMVLFILQ